eukprot:6611838-Lingulodinium_polyedra.AAC.1
MQRALPGWSEEAITAIMRQRGQGESNPVQDLLSKELLEEMVAEKDGQELKDLWVNSMLAQGSTT